MSYAYNKFYQFVEDLVKKVHNLGTSADSLKIALCAAANAPVATNAVLGDLTQISYTNLSTRALVVAGCVQTTGTLKLTITDLVLSASGGAVATFRYIVIYNDTPTSPADPLIAWFDYGANITLNDGESVTLDFDGSAGVLTLT